MSIESFSELYDEIDKFRGGRWNFRGVHDPNYQLIPKIGRKCDAGGERRIFDMFCRELPGYGITIPNNNWELLALGQHHGLPTRFLDWTENPLVAAYFACDGQYDREGVIYVLKTPHVTKDIEEDPFSITKVVRYRPRHITNRTLTSWRFAKTSPFGTTSGVLTNFWVAPRPARSTGTKSCPSCRRMPRPCRSTSK